MGDAQIGELMLSSSRPRRPARIIFSTSGAITLKPDYVIIEGGVVRDGGGAYRAVIDWLERDRGLRYFEGDVVFGSMASNLIFKTEDAECFRIRRGRVFLRGAEDRPRPEILQAVIAWADGFCLKPGGSK